MVTETVTVGVTETETGTPTLTETRTEPCYRRIVRAERRRRDCNSNRYSNSRSDSHNTVTIGVTVLLKSDSMSDSYGMVTV